MYYIGNIQCVPSDIQHHGIKGQKLGVRRYQNEDGTLTALGKKRLYGDVKSVQDYVYNERKKMFDDPTYSSRGEE